MALALRPLERASSMSWRNNSQALRAPERVCGGVCVADTAPESGITSPAPLAGFGGEGSRVTPAPLPGFGGAGSGVTSLAPLAGFGSGGSGALRWPVWPAHLDPKHPVAVDLCRRLADNQRLFLDGRRWLSESSGLTNRAALKR